MSSLQVRISGERKRSEVSSALMLIEASGVDIGGRKEVFGLAIGTLMSEELCPRKIR